MVMRKADWAGSDERTTSHVGADESEDVHRTVCTDPLCLPAGHDVQVAADDADADALYLPAGHDVQVAAADELAPAGP